MSNWLTLVAVAGLLPRDDAAKAPAEPTATNPAGFAMTAKPAMVKPGGKLELKVSAKVLEGWHIYAVDKPVGYSQPTKLAATLPKNWKAVGKWKSSEPKQDANAELETWVHEGEPTFTLEVAVPADAPAGKAELAVTVTAMTCDDSKCLPPKKHKLTTTVTVVP